MCEANAYLKKKGSDHYEEVLFSVDKVIPAADGIQLRNIFGEQKNFQAKITQLQLVDHKILLDEI